MFIKCLFTCNTYIFYTKNYTCVEWNFKIVHKLQLQCCAFIIIILVYIPNLLKLNRPVLEILYYYQNIKSSKSQKPRSSLRTSFRVRSYFLIINYSYIIPSSFLCRHDTKYKNIKYVLPFISWCVHQV